MNRTFMCTYRTALGIPCFATINAPTWFAARLEFQRQYPNAVDVAFEEVPTRADNDVWIVVSPPPREPTAAEVRDKTLREAVAFLDEGNKKAAARYLERLLAKGSP